MSDDLPSLPELWGVYSDWKFRDEPEGGITALRVNDFPTQADARIFNEWAERDYYMQRGSKRIKKDTGDRSSSTLRLGVE